MYCPIVCSAIDGNVDIVTDRETGILFKPGNTEDLTNKLGEALADLPVMKKYAEQLRNKVENNFSQPFVHQCLKEKYLELLAKTG